MNFFNELQKKVDCWKVKYKTKPRKAAFKLAKWCFGGVFKIKNVKCLNTNYQSWIKIEDENHIEITAFYKDVIDDFHIPKIPVNGYIYFDIKKAFSLNPNFKRLGLVIFNGIGDYFLCTAFIEDLKKELSNIPFDAWVSCNKDGNSSPLVAECLKVNPNFENIYTFSGKSNDYFKNYDFNDAYQKASNDTLLVPLIYDFEPSVKSRCFSLCNNYNISKPEIAPLPIIYTDYQSNKCVSEMLDVIARRQPKGIVWLQLKSTCFGYIYPFTQELVDLLANDDWLVICVDKNDASSPNLITLDTKDFSINDSIKLLKLLKDKYNVYCLGVVSCFTAISSGFKIPNLIIQPCYDAQIESVVHPNCYIVSHMRYSCIPASRCFVDETAQNIEDSFCVKFKAQNIFKYFKKMVQLEGN